MLRFGQHLQPIMEGRLIIKLLKKLLKRGSATTPKQSKTQVLHARIIPRDQHVISRKSISANALKVLYRLRDAGFSAYLVGGSVRDLLLGNIPKDFDVATNAHPEQIHKLFRNCRLIGRRFRLAHIHFGREIIEVATFRASSESTLKDDTSLEQIMLLHDNVYGTLEEDAQRRDFTVNALYYNIKDFSVVDYSSGVSDLQKGLLRIIGNPAQRYHEDPVRLLRAVRFAAKLGFTIEPETEKPLFTLGNLISHVPPARLFEEMLKLFQGGKSWQSFQLLQHYDLFKQLFAQTEHYLKHEDNTQQARRLLELTFHNTDKRIVEGKRVTPAFLLAALLWHPAQKLQQQFQADGLRFLLALDKAVETVLYQQIKQTAIPKRLTSTIREIWGLQTQLTQRNPKKILSILEHPRFRAAYDFLLLRAAAGEDLQMISEWWTKVYEADENTRHVLIQHLPKVTTKRKKKFRRKNKSMQHDNKT